MDFNQNDIYYGGLPQGMKMPFYLSYPVQNLYMTEVEYERDRERMQEMYPKEAKELQELIEEECDKMEYDGSMMFDEYPDRMMLQRICDKIYNIAYPDEKKDVEVMQYGRRNLIEVLLFDEMYRRRCRYNRCRRWW